MTFCCASVAVLNIDTNMIFNIIYNLRYFSVLPLGMLFTFRVLNWYFTIE